MLRVRHEINHETDIMKSEWPRLSFLPLALLRLTDSAPVHPDIYMHFDAIKVPLTKGREFV